MKFSEVHVIDSCQAIDKYKEGVLFIWFDGRRKSDTVHLRTATGFVEWKEGVSIKDTLLGTHA